MRQRDRERANKVLDGIVEIAKNEMLVFGHYLSEKVVKPELAEEGAICGGRTACLIGSAYLAAGVKPTVQHQDGREYVWLSHVDIGDREPILETRPALNAAINALNTAAEKWIDKESIYFLDHLYYESPAEGLFEDVRSPYFNRPKDETYKTLLLLIDDARKVLEAS